MEGRASLSGRQEVSYERLEALLKAVSESAAIDLSKHCLLLHEGGGNYRKFYEELFFGDHGHLLYVGTGLPFPLSLIPSHFGVVSLHQAFSIWPVFQKVASQGSTAIIYAPREFQEAYLSRLRSRPRTLNLRARLEATDYRDLLPSYGENYFELWSYLGYDDPIVGYRYGRSLSPDLRELLNGITG